MTVSRSLKAALALGAAVALGTAFDLAGGGAGPGAAQAQQGQQRQQQQRTPQQPPQPQSVTRIPPPGPAEVPLFPAREYTDPRSGISMTVPAGWLVIEVPQVPEGEITRMFIEGPGTPSPSCSLVVQRPQQPARVNQGQLNRMIHDERSVTQVRNSLAREGRRVVAIRRLTQGGIAGLTSQLLVPGNQHAPDITAFVTFFEQVGRRYSLNCSAMTLDLDTMRPDIEAIIRSLRFPTS